MKRSARERGRERDEKERERARKREIRGARADNNKKVCHVMIMKMLLGLMFLFIVKKKSSVLTSNNPVDRAVHSGLDA
jgi:hypothetical protein